MDSSSVAFVCSVLAGSLWTRSISPSPIESEVEYIVVQEGSESYVDLGDFSVSSSSSGGGEGLRMGGFPSDISLGTRLWSTAH